MAIQPVTSVSPLLTKLNNMYFKQSSNPLETGLVLERFEKEEVVDNSWIKKFGKKYRNGKLYDKRNKI